MARQIIQKADWLCRQLPLLLIAVYQRVASPLLGGRCRFYPSCSNYAKSVFSTHSFFRAMWLTVCRLSKCHPLCDGGVDLPPDKK